MAMVMVMGMHLPERVLIFVGQEARFGRMWKRGPNWRDSDLYFSPDPHCINPANAWPHLHLGYTYQDTLRYLGGKTRNLQRIEIFKNNYWNIQAIAQFSQPMQLAILSVQTFWTPPPVR
ncbi:hypothetical protein KKJ06_19865 [Xenorhabdus bovienii]|uniref:Uncharacterized protein n=1 Tax=Xenorhabdus bovienii str. Intermedium TaxID=1379677 RepID=A0A077QMF0_XENBV|nr:hypothetical protein [Xenorhabdus bovienii]MDE9483352.1 hypothetical protein [Xenorhabdus bovienii]MDE9553565.1 hypothetical protein [Xenorhabdus bovienii]MDE9557614.1 hypothetical protein [Xenorhabdus bovienii]MDE9566091.1 hypothetical protein [Xenorhabdus bovienii]CDH34714.1 hypothetical protein XBI1_420003 [Xenorhabdus bovienii str. Intermedium]